MRAAERIRCFPWLLAVYPLLLVWAGSPGEVDLGSLSLALGIALGVATALVLIVRLLSSSTDFAVLVAGLLVVFFYAYGPVHRHLEEERLNALGRTLELNVDASFSDWRLTGLWIAGIAVGIVLICRLGAGPRRGAIRFLDVFSLLLVGWVLSTAGFAALVSGPGGSEADREPESHGVESAGTSPPGPSPDVYFIVLDGYARGDVLREQYGFDNGEFLAALSARGFTIANASTVNYYWTFLSLSSALNFEYLEDVLPSIDPESTDLSDTYRAIRDNSAAAFLRDRGYTFYHLRSTWGATMMNPFADHELPCETSPFVNEYFRAVAETSWLRQFQGRITQDLADCHLQALAHLGRLGGLRGPKFVLAHLLLPHHPYVFDSGGRVLRSANLTNQFELHRGLWEDRAGYLEQLRFLNGRLLLALDELLAASEIPPVIVLQSDHGPQLTKGLGPAGQHRVRFANLAAFHLPGAPAHLVPDDVTAVNSLRIVFSHYFGAELPVLPDRHFFSTFRRPFTLKPVRIVDGDGADRVQDDEGTGAEGP